LVRQASFAVSEGDPLTALGAARMLRTHYLRELETQLVIEARQAGHTWDWIGQALGITRQAAEKAYGAAVRSAQAERAEPPAEPVRLVRRRA
jgi:hypothetical protein